MATNPLIGLTVTGVGALVAWGGITDPPGGIFAELGRVLSGAPAAHVGAGSGAWVGGGGGSLSAPLPQQQQRPGGDAATSRGGDIAHAALRAAGLARAAAAYGSPCVPDSCLHFVRTCYSAPGGVHDAATWWAHAPHKHPGDMNAPAGAPVAWTGGGDGFGHVAISDGLGNVFSTDFPVRGRIGRVPIHSIGGNLHPAGWAEPDFGPGT